MSRLQASSLTLSKGTKVYQFANLANFTTWKIGGSAEWFAEPINIEELKEITAWASTNKIKCTIIGSGSNLLINDSGLSGLIICLRKLHGCKIDKNSGLIEVLAGESLPALTRKAAKSGLYGLHWAVGIPGSVGGASVMNAGAQGGSIHEWIQSVKVIPYQGGESFVIEKNDLAYSYRDSRLQHEQLIVLSAKFELKPGHDIKKLLNKTNMNLQKRTSTQPYHLPSCGSVFRNPTPHKAGELIEKVGLKGFSLGGAEVSRIHANFIVNKGTATANDVNKLIELIQSKVKNEYGIKLQTEVKRLGFD